MTITIGNRKIGKGHPVFIIAEIGVNHEGDFELCKKMVVEAAKAGADAIKLQTVDADENYIKNTPSWQLFRTCELTKSETKEIFELSRKLGMEPFTTSPDIATLNWVDNLGVDVHKISSGMMTNDLIIKKTCEIGRPVLLSTGMGTTSQIDHAMKIAKSTGNKEIALFQCTSEYPVALNELNLATMAWFADRYNITVGFSDHSAGITAAMVAVSMGATIIEKHFTLTPGRKAKIEITNDSGEKEILEVDFDHHIGLSPSDFKDMVDGIRRAEKMSFDDICKDIPEAQSMVGKSERNLSEKLQKVSAGASRCLVARKQIKSGELFTEENVGLKRPFPNNRGMEPFEYDAVIGKSATIDMNIDDPIKKNNVRNFIRNKQVQHKL